jgi:hypothetical protein
MLHTRHSSTQVRSVITITGLGDHDQPDWLITMTGIRSWTRRSQANGSYPNRKDAGPGPASFRAGVLPRSTIFDQPDLRRA